MRVEIRVSSDLGDVTASDEASFTYINAEPGRTIKLQTELDTLLRITEGRIRRAYGIDGIKREATE